MNHRAITSLLCVAALWLAIVLGCSSGGSNESSNTPRHHCQPFETSVKTPEGGQLVSGVTIRRDENGDLNTLWQTSFPAGTKAIITIGMWRPEPKKDIPEGPMYEQTGFNGDSTCDGKTISPNKPFGNDGKGYNAGDYYLDLTVVDNEIWKQPAATHSVIAATRGKLKSITKEDTLTGLDFAISARFSLPPCSELPPGAPPNIPHAPAAAQSGGDAESGVTMANYNRLRTGMSYSQVVKILGSGGTELSSNDIGGYHTVMYMWQGDGGGNMNAMFQNGRLIQKAQFGLQ